MKFKLENFIKENDIIEEKGTMDIDEYLLKVESSASLNLADRDTDGATNDIITDTKTDKQIVEEKEPTPVISDKISEDKADEPQTNNKKLKNTKPKPIIVRYIQDIIDFTEILEKDYDPNFVSANSGRWMKVVDSFCIK